MIEEEKYWQSYDKHCIKELLEDWVPIKKGEAERWLRLEQEK